MLLVKHLLNIQLQLFSLMLHFNVVLNNKNFKYFIEKPN